MKDEICIFAISIDGCRYNADILNLLTPIIDYILKAPQINISEFISENFNDNFALFKCGISVIK